MFTEYKIGLTVKTSLTNLLLNQVNYLREESQMLTMSVRQSLWIGREVTFHTVNYHPKPKKRKTRRKMVMKSQRKILIK